MTSHTMDIMERAEMLPIDMKLELIDRLLESINPAPTEIDEAWKEEVERRIDEVENGKVKLIQLEDVRERMLKRYCK